ncbi:MAG: hypothetical protein ACOC9Y_07275 [Chloroflexota bacterium]
MMATGKRFTVPATFFLLLLLTANLASANGGQVRLEREETGPYLISAFTEPIPMREGEVDLSVQVFDADSEEIIDDGLTILLTAAPLGTDSEAVPIETELTAGEATEPGYHAAKFDIPEAGEWNFQLMVSGETGEGSAHFDADIEVQRSVGRTEILVMLALIPVIGLLILFALRQARDSEDEPAE